MKINFKILTIALTVCLFMTAPFAKAQPTPPAPPTCVELCTSFCTAWATFLNALHTISTPPTNLNIFPTNLLQDMAGFFAAQQQQ